MHARVPEGAGGTLKVDEIPSRKPGHGKATAAIAAAFGTARFPASKDALVQDVGSWKVPLGNGQTATLADILNAVPKDQFQSSQEATNQVDLHWARIEARLRAAEHDARPGTRRER